MNWDAPLEYLSCEESLAGNVLSGPSSGYIPLMVEGPKNGGSRLARIGTQGGKTWAFPIERDVGMHVCGWVGVNAFV